MTIEGLDAAESLLGTANDKAIDIAMAWLHRGEEVARAAVIAAEGFEDKGMETDALSYFEQSLAAAPTARAYAGRGILRRSRNEHDLAAQDFRRALDLDPSSGLAALGLGGIVAVKGNVDEGLALLGRAIEHEKYRARALVERANVYLAANRASEARRDLLSAAELDHAGAAGRLIEDGVSTKKWSGKALLALARYYRMLDEPDREVEATALEGAIAKLEGAEKHDALISLAFCQRFSDAFDDAVETFRRAAKLKPTGRAPGEIARTLFLADKNRAAKTAALQALEAGAEPFEAHRTIGELHAEKGRFAEALEALDRALPLAPSYAIALTQLARGRALIELGREDEARTAWLAAEDAGSTDARDERREHFPAETAADFFDEALEHLDEGDWESAREPLERAAVLFREAMRAPGDFAARQLANVLTNLGNVLRQAGEIQESLRVLEEATGARPLGFEPLVMLGNVLRNCNLPDGALVTVFGEHLLDAQARLRKSIDVYDRATALAHGLPYAHYNRGLALQAAGRWREAVQDFERALAYHDPSKRQDAVFNIIKSMWKAGAFDEAHARCATLFTHEDLETATERNIEALIARRPAYQGDAMLERFSLALDALIELRRSAVKADPDAYPFRFYGVHPGECAPGSNMGHRYRLRFREAPTAATRERLARAVSRAWDYIDLGNGDGSTWQWSGDFAEISLGELESGEIGAFLDEVVDLLKRIHAVAPLVEVVSLNAETLSAGSAEDDAWERWSLSVAPLPTPHPFPDDGVLFFSAYGVRL